MKTKRLFQALALFLGIGFFASCATEIPISNLAPQNNDTYNVSYLFEHDGCKVYRFYDRGHYVYFTNCKGEVTSIKNDSTATRILNINEIVE
ncbi:DUF4884 domain-containing protein [Sunxiuqinia elliptica]